jgi:4-amino-4-deoxy-L-arabinose transferase-like glycosyltransferase
MLLTVSRIIWASTNNGLENTLAVFLIFAVYFYLKASRNNLIYWILSGLFIACGFLTKGPFAFFIWGLPMVFEFLVKNKPFGMAFLSSLKLILVTLVPLIVLYSYSESAFENLSEYYEIQVLNSLKNVETVASRWFILEYFLSEMIIPAVVVSVSLGISYKIFSNFSLEYEKKRLFLAFFLLGLFGVLPIMISMKQSGFYILPTFPIFALSLAFLMYQPSVIVIAKLSKYQNFTLISRVVGVLALVIGISLNLNACAAISGRLNAWNAICILFIFIFYMTFLIKFRYIFLSSFFLAGTSHFFKLTTRFFNI